MSIDLIFGDITTLKADAVVNVIKYKLEDGGRVNADIHMAAGPELETYDSIRNSCPIGGAKLTRGFGLPARYIIHTVAPVWRGGTEYESRWLVSCYQQALALAAKYQCRTVAIPVCSDSGFDFPYGQVLQLAYDTCQYYITENRLPLDICLVMYGRGLDGTKTDEETPRGLPYLGVYVQSRYQLDKAIKNEQRLAGRVQPYFPQDEEEPQLQVRSAKIRYSIRPRPSDTWKLPGREDFTPEASFTQKLLQYMDKKGMTPPVLYNEAGYDRKLFSKIQSDIDYHPRKYTVVRFALALKLDLEETDDLLNAAGFALSRSMLGDIIIEFCIKNNMRSVWEVNNILESWGLETI